MGVLSVEAIESRLCRNQERVRSAERLRDDDRRTAGQRDHFAARDSDDFNLTLDVDAVARVHGYSFSPSGACSPRLVPGPARYCSTFSSPPSPARCTIFSSSWIEETSSSCSFRNHCKNFAVMWSFSFRRSEERRV